MSVYFIEIRSNAVIEGAEKKKIDRLLQLRYLTKELHG